MSDISQGPDWWQASDGKWYAPELYPKDWTPAGIDTAPAELSEPVAAPVESPPEVVAPVEVPPVAEPAAPVPVFEPAQATETVPPVEESAAPPLDPPDIPPFEPPPVPPVAAPQPPPAAPVAPAQPPPAVPIAEPAAQWSPPPEPPSGWSAPDPAASDPTLVAGVAPVSVDATTVQPAYTPPPAAAPTSWDQPVVPPTGYAAPVAESESAGADIPGGLLGLVGGAALVVGSFLAWAKAGGTLAGGTVNGLTGSNGWGTLVCGLVVAAGAGLLIAGQRNGWVGGAMGAAALTGIGLAVFSIIDIGNTSDDLPQVLLDANVDSATANGAVLDLDIGIWIVSAGGAVALLAAILALARRN